MMVVLPVSDVNFDDYLAAFNSAYQDYLVPMRMDAAALQSLIARESIDLGASRVIMEDDQIAAVGMVGLRKTTAWIGGVGVSPAYRNKGFGKQIMLALLEAVRNRGVSTVYLEVIQGNTKAYHLYLHLGFKVIRQLLIIEGQKIAPLANQLNVRAVPAAEALHYFALHAAPNPWQRDRPSLHYYADSMDGRVVRRDNHIVGYAVGWFRQDRIRWMDIVGQDETILRALIATVHQDAPDASAGMINLPADDPAWAVFESFGYKTTMIQFEMQLDFNEANEGNGQSG